MLARPVLQARVGLAVAPKLQPKGGYGASLHPRTSSAKREHQGDVQNDSLVGFAYKPMPPLVSEGPLLDGQS